MRGAGNQIPTHKARMMRRGLVLLLLLVPLAQARAPGPGTPEDEWVVGQVDDLTNSTSTEIEDETSISEPEIVDQSNETISAGGSHSQVISVDEETHVTIMVNATENEDTSDTTVDILTNSTVNIQGNTDGGDIDDPIINTGGMIGDPLALIEALLSRNETTRVNGTLVSATSAAHAATSAAALLLSVILVPRLFA